MDEQRSNRMRIDKQVGARWLQAVALGRDRALSADGRAAVQP